MLFLLLWVTLVVAEYDVPYYLWSENNTVCAGPPVQIHMQPGDTCFAIRSSSALIQCSDPGGAGSEWIFHYWSGRSCAGAYVNYSGFNFDCVDAPAMGFELMVDCLNADEESEGDSDSGSASAPNFLLILIVTLLQL